MKSINTQALLSLLEADTRSLIREAEKLKSESSALLTESPGPGKWSVAQVLAHLNQYGDYYLPAIETKMQQVPAEVKKDFKPGWLGDYFTKMMHPGTDGVKNKMKAMKSYSPSPDIDAVAAVNEFLRQQKQMLRLLDTARTADLSIRVPSSLTKLVALKLGDTFRFFIAHELRHFVQIANTLQVVRDYDRYQEAHPAI